MDTNDVALLRQKLAKADSRCMELLSQQTQLKNDVVRLENSLDDLRSTQSIPLREQHDDDEEDARQQAEMVMSRLLHSINVQRSCEEDRSRVQQELFETQAELDRTRGKEAELLKIVSKYQDLWGSDPLHVNNSSHSTSQQSPPAADIPLALLPMFEAAVKNAAAIDGNRDLLLSTKLAIYESSGKVGDESTKELQRNSSAEAKVESDRPLNGTAEYAAQVMSMTSEISSLRKQVKGLKHDIANRDRSIGELRILLKAHIAQK